jgi:uncharacterized membrane protein
MIIVVLGAGLYLAQDGLTYHDYERFRGEPAVLRSPAGIVRGALALDSRGIIMLGILALLATPFARVAFSLVTFALQKDAIYTLATLIVLAVLAYSLLGQ